MVRCISKLVLFKKTVSIAGIFLFTTGILWAGGGQAAAPSGGGGAGKLFPKERTLTILMPENSQQPLKEWSPMQEAILEKTNIRIKYDVVSGTSGADRLNILFATNQIPEIVREHNLIKNNAASGMFLPLMKYINNGSLPNYKRYWDSLPNLKKDTVDGELYYFHQLQYEEIAFSFGPVIRTDLLRKHNLPVPNTFDQLLDVLEALKKIYPDSRPWSTRNGTRQLFATTAYMLGSGFATPEYDPASPLYYDKNQGKYICGPATPEFKTVLKFFADAYRRGVLNPDYAIDTNDVFRSRLNSGQSFFYNDNTSFNIDYTNVLRQTTPDATLEFIPFLTNSYGQRRAISYTDDLRSGVYALRSDIKDPDQVIKFMDWLYSDEGRDITNYGKEGATFRYNAQGKAEYIPEYVNRFLGQPSVYYAFFSDAGITCNAFAPIGGNSKCLIEVYKIIGSWAGQTENYWNLVQEEHKPGNALESPWAPPPLTKIQLDRTNEIRLALNTYLDQEYDKYILGREPVDNWDKVIAEAVRLGARELEDIYNTANAAFR
jgi:ABC-type glycerol-3-phosphate transport system substrate-binding protein